MDDLGTATENQVILAWLQAEIESVSFQQYLAGEPPNPVYLAQALRAARSPNLRDADQNELRRKIVVRTHGFGLGIKSFEGLANDIQWRRARLTSHEVGELLYASGHPAWSALAPVTRKVAEGASNVGHVFTGDQTNMLVLALALRIADSHPDAGAARDHLPHAPGLQPRDHGRPHTRHRDHARGAPDPAGDRLRRRLAERRELGLSLIHISEPTRLGMSS